MSSLATDYYQITDEVIKNVRESFGKDEESVREDLKIINSWWSKQLHLPPNTDDGRLERILLRNKFRIERTKTKIDNYYSLRALHSDHFNDIRQNYDDILAATDDIYISQAPTLTAQHERVVTCSIRSRIHNPLPWRRLYSYAFLCLESQFSHDYTVGERYVIDCSNMSLQYCASMTAEVAQFLIAVRLYQEAYSGRVIALHCVNIPPFWDRLFAVLKRILKPKLIAKVIIHNSLDDLYVAVDRKFLPSCLGGSLQSSQHYHDSLKMILLHQKEDILKNLSKVSNEALRNNPTDNHLFGIDGTFKKINVD